MRQGEVGVSGRASIALRQRRGADFSECARRPGGGGGGDDYDGVAANHSLPARQQECIRVGTECVGVRHWRAVRGFSGRLLPPLEFLTDRSAFRPPPKIFVPACAHIYFSASPTERAHGCGGTGHCPGRVFGAMSMSTLHRHGSAGVVDVTRLVGSAAGCGGWPALQAWQKVSRGAGRPDGPA